MSEIEIAADVSSSSSVKSSGPTGFPISEIEIVADVPSSSSLKSYRPTIWKVPKHSKDENRSAYEPLFITIGPYHHKKGEFVLSEKIKQDYLLELCRRDARNTRDNYKRVVREKISDVRDHYLEKIDLEDDELVDILVTDGCFIIEMLLKQAKGEVHYPFNSIWYVKLLARDLSLLENQIPFFVLEELFRETNLNIKPKKEFRPPKLMDYAMHFFKMYRPLGKISDEGNKPIDLLPERVHHLLHLFYLFELRLPMNGQQENTNASRPSPENVGNVDQSEARDLSQKEKSEARDLSQKEKPKVREYPRIIPCATKLKQAGLKFKKKSETCKLTKISISNGELEIPVLRIKEHTISYLKNLVALEQCRVEGVKSEFTSYCVFLVRMIDSTLDIALLEKHGIVEHNTGDQAELLQKINSLAIGTNMDYKKLHLADVFQRLNKHHGSRWNRWRVDLHNYFPNPWVTMAVLGSLLLLLLSVAQMLFTVLSYLKVKTVRLKH